METLYENNICCVMASIPRNKNGWIYGACSVIKFENKHEKMNEHEILKGLAGGGLCFRSYYVIITVACIYDY